MIASADPFRMIDLAHLAPGSRLQYKNALRRFYTETGAEITDVEVLTAYAAELPRSGRAFLKAAVRHYTDGMVSSLKSGATAANVGEVQASLYRLEALRDAVKVKQTDGLKVHHWLTQDQVQALFATCTDGIVGLCDKVLLGLLVAAGLRREEAASLRFEDVKQQHTGKRARAVLAVKGKGAKDRAVPISDALAAALREWGRIVGGKGYIARSVNGDCCFGETLSGQGVFDVVAKRGPMIGMPDLQPHDLRRSFAQLGFEAGISITQISVLLGHASVATTQRYLNLELDLERTISDVIPMEGEGSEAHPSSCAGESAVV